RSCGRPFTSLLCIRSDNRRWAKAYYQHLREDENKTYQAAVRSLAYKWIRIIFRCWKDGKPYDEEVYLQSLRRALPDRGCSRDTHRCWVADGRRFSKTF